MVIVIFIYKFVINSNNNNYNDRPYYVNYKFLIRFFLFVLLVCIMITCFVFFFNYITN